MKKFLSMGALALTLAAVCSAPAPAWLNWKFGLGMNFGWQSGGNNTLWGLFRNGQPPGPDCGGGGGCPLPPGGPGYVAPAFGAPFQPNSLDNQAARPNIGGPTAYQSSYLQAPWTNSYTNNGYNYGSTVGYQSSYYPYYNYGYGYGAYNYYNNR